jgi:HSP20 family molecular chaperone IbpA
MNLLTKNEKPTHVTTNRVITPHYDVRENTEAYVVTAWVPGVDRSTLETTVDGETLTITGRRAFTVPTDWTPVYREIPQADFRLVLEIDRRFNRDGIKAELTQGVLTLTLPKAEAVKPRKIEILG